MQQNDSKHFLSLTDRKMLFVQGAKDVDSFDEKSIIVQTDKGLLTIKGEELHIKALNLDEEKLEVVGYVNALIYNDGKGKAVRKNGQGFLKKLLK